MPPPEEKKTTIEYNGKTYEVKRTYHRNDKLVFVVDTDELYGPNKNTILAELVDMVNFSDGRVLVPGKET